MRFDKGTLVLQGLDQEQVSGLFDQDTWHWDGRILAFRANACHYKKVRKTLHQTFGARFRDEVCQPAGRKTGFKVSLPHCEERARALEAWQARDHLGTVAVSSEEAGEALLLTAMAHEPFFTLLVVPHRDRALAWRKKIETLLISPVGLLLGKVGELFPITVTTYPVARAQMDRMGDRFGLLLFEDWPRLKNRHLLETALLCTAEKRLGISGRSEPLGVGQRPEREPLGALVYCLTRGEYGGARPPLCRRESLPVTDDSFLDTLGTIIQHHPGQRLVVFVESLNRALKISIRFLLPFLSRRIHPEEGLALINGFSAQTYSGLVVEGIPEEGLALPGVQVVVLLGKEMGTLRAVGRVDGFLQRSAGGNVHLYHLTSEQSVGA